MGSISDTIEKCVDSPLSNLFKSENCLVGDKYAVFSYITSCCGRDVIVIAYNGCFVI